MAGSKAKSRTHFFTPSVIEKKYPLQARKEEKLPWSTKKLQVNIGEYLEESIKLALIPHQVGKVGDKAIALFIRGFIVGVFRIDT